MDNLALDHLPPFQNAEVSHVRLPYRRSPVRHRA
jgi:hypothetical protein